MKKRYSLKLLFIAIAIAGCLSAGVRTYLIWRIDYIDPPPDPNVREFTREETAILKKGAEHYKNIMVANHPSKGKVFWEQQLSKLKRGMVRDAIQRYMTYASPSYSLMTSDGSQIAYFAVDSEFAVAIRFDNTMGGDGRVVHPVCTFSHSLKLDDFGGIDLDALPDVMEILAEESANRAR